MSNITARPKSVLIIFIMLLLLAVASAVTVGTSLIPRSGFNAAGGRQFVPRSTPGPGTPQSRADAASGTPAPGQPATRHFPGPSGNTGGGGAFLGTGTNGGGTNAQGNGGGNFQGRGGAGFSLFTITRMLGLPNQVVGILVLAFPIIGILLLLFGAFGIWKVQRWGLNLATILGVIFLIGALPGLFSIGGRNINWLRIGMDILSLVGTVTILALSFLPSVRDYFPKNAPKPKAG
jgi:hypothetical protein